MTPGEADALRRENQYLRTRVAQLQEDVGGLSAELERLRQRLEHTMARGAEPPNPVGGH